MCSSGCFFRVFCVLVFSFTPLLHILGDAMISVVNEDLSKNNTIVQPLGASTTFYAEHIQQQQLLLTSRRRLSIFGGKEPAAVNDQAKSRPEVVIYVSHTTNIITHLSLSHTTRSPAVSAILSLPPHSVANHHSSGCHYYDNFYP